MAINEKSWTKNRIFVPVSLIVLSLVILTVDSKRREAGRTPAAYFLPVFSHLQKYTTVTYRSVRDFMHGVFRSRGMIVKNRRLMEKVQFLNEKISQLEEYERENVELRKLLKFRSKGRIGKILRDSVGAEVIGRNASNWYETLMIDRGRKDGLRRDMVVISGEGLVGRITRIGSVTSQVLLILDEDSCVSAIIQRTKSHGIVQGQLSHILNMKYLSDKDEIVRGDAVRSSGLGGIYPEGLLIGTITESKKADFGLTVSAEMLPAVDFSRLENVFVLKSH